MYYFVIVSISSESIKFDQLLVCYGETVPDDHDNVICVWT
jgi:hypothetical protein